MWIFICIFANKYANIEKYEYKYDTGIKNKKLPVL